MLADLNRRFARYTAANTALQRVYKKAWNDVAADVSAAEKTANATSAYFELLKKDMAYKGMPVKFDMTTGKYFLARNAEGKEVFHIKVARVQECVMEIAADNLQAALDLATTEFIEGTANKTLEVTETVVPTDVTTED